jgi:hypothetical protein
MGLGRVADADRFAAAVQIASSAKTNMAFILAESTPEVLCVSAFGLPQKSGRELTDPGRNP